MMTRDGVLYRGVPTEESDSSEQDSLVGDSITRKALYNQEDFLSR
jgi:hypothetical protein